MTSAMTIERMPDAESLSPRYVMYRPADAGARPVLGWPLILFLHGSGERGDDIDLVRRYGLPARIEAENVDLPAIVIAPQCPLEARWTDHLPALNDLLDHGLAAQPVDPNRVIVTGLSMGGQGAWALSAQQPDRFAAIAAVCGRIPEQPGWPEAVCVLKDKPIWIFHGDADSRVPVDQSIILAETLRSCGGDPRLTIYPGVGHNAWDRAYAEPDLLPWMLAQRR
jgi:predicted peptidase